MVIELLFIWAISILRYQIALEPWKQIACVLLSVLTINEVNGIYLIKLKRSPHIWLQLPHVPVAEI